MLKDLAEMIGITEVGLSKSLNGNPNINRLEEIASALDVPVTELFEKPEKGVIHCPHCGKKIHFDGEPRMPEHKNIRGKEYYK